jgi:hypothetical protein
MADMRARCTGCVVMEPQAEQVPDRHFALVMAVLRAGSDAATGV